LFYSRALGIINQAFHPAKVQKLTRLSAYKTLARLRLIYGSEAWTIGKQDKQRLTTAEIKLMRKLQVVVCKTI
jgi:hypothetical protein